MPEPNSIAKDIIDKQVRIPKLNEVFSLIGAKK